MPIICGLYVCVLCLRAQEEVSFCVLVALVGVRGTRHKKQQMESSPETVTTTFSSFTNKQGQRQKEKKICPTQAHGKSSTVFWFSFVCVCEN